MKHLPEDRPQFEASPGAQHIVPDHMVGAQMSGLKESFRDEWEGQGPHVDAVMAREHTKEANLRARLTDLGVPKHLRDRTFVHADADPHKDSIVMPWEVIYSLISSDRDKNGNVAANRMGAMG